MIGRLVISFCSSLSFWFVFLLVLFLVFPNLREGIRHDLDTINSGVLPYVPGGFESLFVVVILGSVSLCLILYILLSMYGGV